MKLLLYLFLLLSVQVFAQSVPFRVVLDAGHGGRDPGKVSGVITEKDIVLKVSKLVGAELKKQGGYAVTYTREDDSFVELLERGQIANRAKADVFVSIHCNSAPNTAAEGVETYVLGGGEAAEKNLETSRVVQTENAVITKEANYEKVYSEFLTPESVIELTLQQEESLEKSIRLAKEIQTQFVKGIARKDRQVRQAGFIVLHQTIMPSVLIEIGFLSNAQERAYLNSAKGQQEVAQAIAKAIKAYRTWIRANTTTKQTSLAPTPQVFYRVQVASSARNLKTSPENFLGLTPIVKETTTTTRNNVLYKYLYGYATNEQEAKRMVQQARNKGYKDAYIVTYKNGKRTDGK